MKLEEVLPAMREGRIALDPRGYRTKVTEDGYVMFFAGDTKRWVKSSAFPVDGWTLEPEPKVEWPKGSVQSVLPHAMSGRRIFRKGWLHTIALSEVNINNIMPNDLLALDWEVVP